MKISAPHFSKFLTGDALEYAYNVVTRCRERQPPMSPTEPQVNAVQAAAEALNENYKLELASPLSNNLWDLDQERDRLIIGLHTTAEGQTYHFDPAIAAAASQLLTAMDKYGTRIAKLNYEIETTTLNSLINDITSSPALTAAMAKLNLSTGIPQMQSVNDRFRQIFSHRVGNETDNTHTPTPELRNHLRDALRQLFNHLTAHATLHPDPNLEAIISDINVLTARFNLIAQKRLTPDGKSDDETTK